MKNLSHEDILIAVFLIISIGAATWRIMTRDNSNYNIHITDQWNSQNQNFKLSFKNSPEQINSQTFFTNSQISNTNQQQCNLSPEGLFCNGTLAFSYENNKKFLQSNEKYFTGKITNIYKLHLALMDDENHIVINGNDAFFKILNNSTITSSGEEVYIPINNQTTWTLIVFTNTYRWRSSWDMIMIDWVKILPRFHTLNTAYNIQWKELSFETILVPKPLNNYGYNSTAIINKDKDVTNLSLSLQDNIYTAPIFTFQGFRRSKNTAYSVSLQPQHWEIPQFLRSGNDVIISLSGLKKDITYSLLLKNSEETYAIIFTTLGNFSETKNENIATQEETLPSYSYGIKPQKITKIINNYHLCYTHPLDEQKTTTALSQTLWSGNFSIAFSQNTNTYNTIEQRNYCMMFYYYLNPEKNNVFLLSGITSIFGDKMTSKITIPPHQIADENKYATVVGDRINTIPSQSLKSNIIQIAYKNIKKGTLYYRTCDIVTGNTLNIKAINNPDINHELIKLFSDCGSTKSFAITFPTFERWKAKVFELDLKKLFPEGIPSYFQIAFDDFSRQEGKFFLSTNMGTLQKTTKDTIHTRSFHFNDGTPITTGTYELISINQNNIIKTFTWEISSQDWYLSLQIPDIKMGALKIISSGDSSINILWDLWSNYSIDVNQYRNTYNNFAVDSYQIGGGINWMDNKNFRLYAFTERVLYKPGDEIFVSGWMRKPWLSKQKSNAPITLTLLGPDYNEITSKTIRSTDAFWGFTSSFKLSKSAPLWNYSIRYTSIINNTSIEYTSYLQVQEYKKSPIQLVMNLTTGEKTQVMIHPSYYFGPDLKSFDIDINYTLQGQIYGLWDRSACGQNWCDTPIYYWRIWWQEPNSWGSLKLTSYKNKILFLDIQDIKTRFISTLDLTINLNDNLTKENIIKSSSYTLYPQYLVGIQGYDYDWKDIKSDYVLKGTIKKLKTTDKEWLQNYEPNSDWGKVNIEIFYKSYAINEQKGPDGERYSINGDNYKLIDSLSTSLNTDGTYQITIPFSTGGAYFLKVTYKDIYESQQTINVYNTNGQMSRYGEIANNFKLNIFAKEKDFQDGEQVDINIEPYIKGATAIITAEKDGQILEKRTVILDWNPLKMTMKKARYPNIYVGVVQIVSEQLNTKLSKKRSEPRFFIGYKNLKLSPSMMKINTDITITNTGNNIQELYKPWQTIKLSLQTKDYKNKPLPSRLSVAVVDKGLIDIYDEIKKPLEAFYLFSYPDFSISTNFKTLYKMLKVFSSDGTKGGGGEGGDGSPINLSETRKNFLDVAYRSGSVLTDKQGKKSLTFTLPDNLTTWMVEVIGTTQQGEMDSTRTFFKVGKEVVLNVNLPKFLTLGDRITIPASTISNTNLPKPYQLTGTIRIGNEIQALIFSQDQKTFDIDLNTFKLPTLLNNDQITFNIQAQPYDAIQVSLPLRKEGAMMKTYLSTQQSQVNTSVNLNDTPQYIQATIGVSFLPLKVLQNAITYLIQYPYGCSEQLISWLYPIIIAKQLSTKWYLSSGIVSGNFLTRNGTNKDINMLVQEIIEKLKLNKKTDGLLGYRPDSWNQSDLNLSIYTWSVLSQIQKAWFPVDKIFISELEKNISAKINTPTAQLYFMLQQSFNGIKPNLLKVEEILNQTGFQEIHQILAYTLYAFQGIDKPELEKKIDSYLKNNWTQVPSREIYYNPNILKAIYLRGLIKNDKKQKATTWVSYFQQHLNDQWIRSWSTQENMQILLSLYEYINKTQIAQKSLTYQGKIWDQTFQGTLNQSNPITFHTLNLDPSAKVPITFKASENIMMDIQLTYLPSASSNIPEQNNNVSNFSLTNPNSKGINVGETTTLEGKFTLTQDAKHLAIDYQIPANYSIINTDFEKTISTQTENSSNGYGYVWDNCTPKHFEVRYDKLFLYYESLNAGASCTITFNVVKTHEGKTRMPFIRLFEMYDAVVYSSKILK